MRSVLTGIFRVLFIHSRTQSDSELVSEGLAFAALLIRSVCSQLSLRAVNALLWAPGAWQLLPKPRFRRAHTVSWLKKYY